MQIIVIYSYYLALNTQIYYEALLQNDRKVARPELLYLLRTRNECDEVQLVDMLVGLCRNCVRASTSHVTRRYLTSGFNTVRIQACRFHKCAVWPPQSLDSQLQNFWRAI